MILQKLRKKLESLVLAASMLFVPSAAKAVPYEDPPHIAYTQEHKLESRAAVLGANVALGCLKSGIGSKMNGRGFWRGCSRGALAGVLVYTGEWIATYNRYPMVGASGKLVHDLGISMQDNVMRGEDILSQYQTELGPVTLTFRKSITPKVSFTTLPLAAIVANFVVGQEFDFKNSLYNLTPVFRMQHRYGRMTGGSAGGYALGNVVSYYPDRFGDDARTLSHEFNHALFWSKLRFSGDLLLKIPYMGQIEEKWNVGQDMAYGLINLPMLFDSDAYFFQPHELEAFSMDRDENGY